MDRVHLVCQAGYTGDTRDAEFRYRLVSAPKVTCMLGNNGTFSYEQFVLLGVGGGGASESVQWGYEDEIAWIKAQKHEWVWNVLERMSSSMCEHRTSGWRPGWPEGDCHTEEAS